MESFEVRRLLSAAATQETDLHGISSEIAACQPIVQPSGIVSLAESMKDTPPVLSGVAPRGGPPFSPIRVQNSRLGAPVTIYLDFDGEDPFFWDAGGHYLVNGPAGQTDPVPGFSLDANSNSYTTDELDGIDAIWAQTAEKFSPFNINVTTVRPGSFNDAEAVHMIIGGSTFDWYQSLPLPMGVGPAGGVAPFEGFTRSEASNEGFVFSADAIPAGSTTLDQGTRHFIAESLAHEAGHLFGLQHQSVVVGNTVTVEYSNGDSITVPIMGNSSNNGQKRGIWLNGLTSDRDANNNIVPTGPQDDLAVLTRPGTNISYRPDDFGSFSGSGALAVDSQTGLVTGGGVIERVGDQDAFTFVATGPVLSLTVNQLMLGGTIIPGQLATTPGMLAPTLELIPLSGSTPAITLNTNNTSATISTANATPGQGFVLRVTPQGNTYGNMGQYAIAGNVGTFATMNGSTLVVSGYNTNNNLKISYNSGTDQIVLQDDVFGGSAVQQFPRGPVTGIVVNGQGGNDIIDIFGQFSVLNIPVTVNGGNGSDTLVLQGTTGNDYQALKAARGFQSNNTTGVYNSVESAILTGFDGADTFEVYETAVGFGTTINGGNQNDVFTVGASAFASNLVQGPVSVFGDAGGDTLNIGSNNADSVNVNVTFDGGAGGGNSIVYNDTAPIYTVRYDIFSNRVNRDGFNVPLDLNYFNVGTITVNAGAGSDVFTIRSGVSAVVHAFGNDGNDSFNVGGGNMNGFFPQDINGGNGTDQIIFDDSLNPANKLWDVNSDFLPNGVIYAGLIMLSTTNFESVGILAGLGHDTITFANTIGQAYTVDAGGGSDTFTLGVTDLVFFTQPVTLVGGSQGTTFNINEAAVSVFTTPLVMDGGNGFNVMNVNVPNVTNFTLGPGYFIPGNGGAFSYTNIRTYVFNGNALNNVYTVYSAGIDFGTFTLNGNLGNDTFTLLPQPGGYTFQNLTLDGNQGTDTFTYDATALATNESYTLGTNVIQRQVGGFGSETVTTASMNSITLTCGGGNDSIFVSQYSAGLPVVVNGGLGDDVCDFGGGDIASNITNIASFLFNGLGGTDTFNLRNATPANSFTYTQTNNTNIQASRTFPSSYFLSLECFNTEQKAVYAGPAADILNITSFASGELSFHGAGGDDAMNLPTSSELLGRRVNFFGDAGTANRINQITNSKTAASTMHVTQNTIGAYLGDTFFAPGGSVFFDSTQIIQLRMGSGSDTAYAQPLATGTLSIDGNLPPNGPGVRDKLNLATAALTSPSVNGTAASGNLTSTNRPTMSWTGFEGTVSTDAVAPAVITADINLNGIPGVAESGNRQAVDVRFSENVSGLISPASLVLTNLTTAQVIPAANIAVTYDAPTNTAHFTFPGYPNGVLPDGDYQGRVLAGLPDFFGNGLPADLNFNFFFMQGDANHDRQVNSDDFNILATNFGTAGRVFSEGDFNYDGVVNSDDFNILAGNFGVTLAADPSAARATFGGIRIRDRALTHPQSSEPLERLLA
jgi:hypothetical protein